MNSKLRLNPGIQTIVRIGFAKTYIGQLGFIWSTYIYLFMVESGYIPVAIVYLQHDVIMMP